MPCAGAEDVEEDDAESEEVEAEDVVTEDTGESASAEPGDEASPGLLSTLTCVD